MDENVRCPPAPILISSEIRRVPFFFSRSTVAARSLDLQGNVVQALAALRNKLRDRRIVGSGLQQLDTAFADAAP